MCLVNKNYRILGGRLCLALVLNLGVAQWSFAGSPDQGASASSTTDAEKLAEDAGNIYGGACNPDDKNCKKFSSVGEVRGAIALEDFLSVLNTCTAVRESGSVPLFEKISTFLLKDQKPEKTRFDQRNFEYESQRMVTSALEVYSSNEYEMPNSIRILGIADGYKIYDNGKLTGGYRYNTDSFIYSDSGININGKYKLNINYGFNISNIENIPEVSYYSKAPLFVTFDYQASEKTDEWGNPERGIVALSNLQIHPPASDPSSGLPILQFKNKRSNKHVFNVSIDDYLNCLTTGIQKFSKM